MNWQFIVFTKHFLGLSLEDLARTISDLGGQGADLCVRPGYPVDPENSPRELPRASKIFREQGLSIPLITTPTDFVYPKAPVVEKLFSACQEAGVELVKLGYWYPGERGYWDTVDSVRRDIEGFAKVAEKYSLKVLIHNHSGNTMGLNSCSAMNLVKGFNPRYVGIFADVGHLSLVGEPLPMALDIVKEYLSAVALKDVVRERVILEGKRRWQLRVVPLGEGYVDWWSLPKVLKDVGFSGPLSVHSEYSELELPDVIDQTRMDMRFLKKLFSEG